MVIEETETSPSKSLAVLQVRGGKKMMGEERGNVDKESFAVVSQECLLSSSDGGTEGLEKFLRDKLESLGGDAIENIADVDPAGVLGLLDSNLVDPDNTGSGMVTVDDKFPRSPGVRWMRFSVRSWEERRLVLEPSGHCVMCSLAWQMNGLQRVAFEVDDSGGKSFCDRYTVTGVSDAGQLFPKSSRLDDTEYGTSELESIARDELVVCVGGGFLKLQNLIFQLSPELQCGLIWLLGVQSFTAVSLQEPY